MNRHTAFAPKMTATELAAYWSALSLRHLPASEDGLEVICFAGMPHWFNRFMHRYQVKAFNRLLRGRSFADCDVLDVGTGVGRWARWFAEWPGARVTGIDIEPDRLARASAHDDGIVYKRMPVDCLDFDDHSFDVVNCVTVLQHVDAATKSRALAEIARVLRPDGHVVLFEVTDMFDDAPHVFPWPEARWVSELGAHGLNVERIVGDQYIPLLRGAKALGRRAKGDETRAEIDAVKTGRRTVRDRALLLALRGLVTASYPIEEVARYLPTRSARISGFLGRRERSGRTHA